MRITSRNLIIAWATISALWAVFNICVTIYVLNFFNLSIFDYSWKDIFFRVGPHFVVFPSCLAIVLWLAWKMVLVARNKVNK